MLWGDAQQCGQGLAVHSFDALASYPFGAEHPDFETWHVTNS